VYLKNAFTLSGIRKMAAKKKKSGKNPRNDDKLAD